MTVRFTSLPQGSPEKSAIIAGVQDGASKQFVVHPAHLKNPATAKEVRDGREANKIVTPRTLNARMQSLEIDVAHAWDPWGTYNIKGGATGTAIASLPYSLNHTYLTTHSDDLTSLIPDTPAKTANECIRLLSMTSANLLRVLNMPLGTVYATGILIEKRDGSFMMLVRQKSLNGKYEVYSAKSATAPTWVKMTEESLVQDVHGIIDGGGWDIAANSAQNHPVRGASITDSDFDKSPWVIRRIGNTLYAFGLGYKTDQECRFVFVEQDYRVGVPSGISDGSLALAKIKYSDGTAGQVATVTSTGVAWQDSASGLPSGGTAGQVVTKTSSGSEWQNVPTELPSGGTTGQVVTRTDGGTAWQAVPTELPSGGTAGQVVAKASSGTEWKTLDNPIKIVDAAADLPTSPATDDLVIVGATSTFYSGGVSFYTGRTYRYTGSAWTLVSRPLSANDLSTGTVDDDRLPSDISQSKIGASAAEGRLLIAGSGTTASWRAANYVKGMADGTEFSGTNFINHPIGTVFEIVGDFTIAGGNSHAGSYKQGERWRKTGASAVTKMTAAAPTSIAASMIDAGSATVGQVLTATGSGSGTVWAYPGLTMRRLTAAATVVGSTWAVGDWIYNTRNSTSTVYVLVNGVQNATSIPAYSIRVFNGISSNVPQLLIPPKFSTEMLSSGNATSGQIATANGSGSVTYEDAPSGLPEDAFICHLVNANKVVPDDWKVGHGVLNTNQSGSVTITRGTGSASVQRGRFGIITALTTNTITVAYIALHPQNIKFNTSKANYIISVDAGGYVNSIQRLAHFHIGTGTPSAGDVPTIQSDGTSIAWQASGGIPTTSDLDDLWGANSTYSFSPAAANAPATLRGTGFVHTHNNVQIVDMTSDSNRWHRARTATYGALGSITNITATAWEGWSQVTSTTNLNTVAAGRYVWYGGTNSSAVPVNAPLIGESGSNGYEASAADRVACAIISDDYQIVAHGTSVLPIYNTGNSISVRRKTGNTWGSWTRIKNTLTNAITALAGIPNVVSDPEQIPTGSTDWHLVVPHESFAATKHPLAASGGATNFYFCRFSTAAGTTIQFVYGIGTSSSQRAVRREATFTLAAGSWTRFGLHVT